MGEAKRRGTYEERRAAAIKRESDRRLAEYSTGMEIQRRKPSPKHAMLMAMLAGLAYASAPPSPDSLRGDE